MHMNKQLVFRSWSRFFVITMIVGGGVYFLLGVMVSLALAVVMSDVDPSGAVGAISGFVIGLFGFAWVSYLGYLHATRNLLRQMQAAQHINEI